MIPLFCSRILHACPVIESHDVDLIPARTHDAVIRDLPEKKSSSPPPLWPQASTSPSAMKRSIRAVTTGSGTEPSSSTASWKARMLNLKLARSPTCSSLPSRLYVDHSHCPCSRQLPLAALPSTRAIPNRDVFYVSDPISSIRSERFLRSRGE